LHTSKDLFEVDSKDTRITKFVKAS
jgi:hypothetical protein